MERRPAVIPSPSKLLDVVPDSNHVLCLPAIMDTSYGIWDEDELTLTMPLWAPGVWSWNDDWQGGKFFFGAWLLRAEFIFHFDEMIEHAQIETPLLGGSPQIGPFGVHLSVTDLQFGRGSSFQMIRSIQNENLWIREHFYRNGTHDIPDHPIRVVSCLDGPHEDNIHLSLSSIPDHPAFDRHGKMKSWGSTTRQLIRRRAHGHDHHRTHVEL